MCVLSVCGSVVCIFYIFTGDSFISFIFFFFKQKTAYEMRISDWSSDVCSSDLDIPAALKEAHRVLRYGGRFFCLEFSTNEWPGFAQVYDAYSHHLVPKLGKLIAQDEDSYRYLIESIRRFPPMPAFAKMIRDAGFSAVKVEPIMGGLVAIHSGWKA